MKLPWKRVVALAILLVIVFSIWRVDPPTLETQTVFPTGAHTGPREFEAVGWDGSASCPKALLDLGAEGIVRSEPGSIEGLRSLHSLPKNYSLEGEPSRLEPRDRSRVTYPPEGSCVWDYAVTLWGFTQNVTNHAPTQIPDQRGVPVTFASTQVKIVPYSEGLNDTFFAVEGIAENPCALSLRFALFPIPRWPWQDISHRPEAAVAGDTVRPLICGGGEFVFAFGVGSPGIDKGQLVLIPSYDNAMRAAPDAKFARLFRLEQPRDRWDWLPFGTASAAPGLPMAEDAHGAASVLELAANAVEPLGARGSPQHRQGTRPASVLTNIDQLSLEIGDSRVKAETSYAWDRTDKTPKLIVRSITPSSGSLTQSIGTTATLLRIYADGQTISTSFPADDPGAAVAGLQATVGLGTSMDELLARNGVRTGAAPILTHANRAAIGAEALLHLSDSVSADAFTRLEGQRGLADTAVTAIASTTGVGRGAMLVTDGSLWVLDKAGVEEARETVETIKDEFWARTLGLKDSEIAREAFRLTMEEVEDMVIYHEAPVLPVAPQRDTPGLSPTLTAVVLVAVAAIWWRRGRARP